MRRSVGPRKGLASARLTKNMRHNPSSVINVFLGTVGQFRRNQFSLILLKRIDFETSFTGSFTCFIEKGFDEF